MNFRRFLAELLGATSTGPPVQASRRRGRGRRSGRSGQRGIPRGRATGYPLGHFFVCYAVAMVALCVFTAIAPPIGLLVYFGTGYYLNRVILRQVQWHKYTVTLSDVAGAKVCMFLLWPLAYARLLGQIAIAQWL